jgi:acetolactate synthase I/II/III large subunit
MRCADALMNVLSQYVDTVFYLPGGGSGPLVDALGRSNLRGVCCLHEQGAGFAAVGYSMLRGLGVCLTTSGPGATNAVTPCLAAWLDSVPVVFISGQVMRKWAAAAGQRSFGVQEAPTQEIVRPITKFVHRPTSGRDAVNTLRTMILIAKNERPGPVWLDVPQDVQMEEV